MLCFPPDHAQPPRCLVGSVQIARGNVGVHARALHWRRIVLQVLLCIRNNLSCSWLVLWSLGTLRSTATPQFSQPRSLHPPLNHAWPSMRLSSRMHCRLCDLIILPRYSSLERKSCDPPIVGMLFVFFTEEEMKVSLPVRSKPLSASLQLSPHRLKCWHVPRFATYPGRGERADQGEILCLHVSHGRRHVLHGPRRQPA